MVGVNNAESVTQATDAGAGDSRHLLRAASEPHRAENMLLMAHLLDNGGDNLIMGHTR